MQKLRLAIAVVALFSQSSVVVVGADETAGGKIVFYSERDGNAEIYVMSTEGSGQTRLTTNSSSEFCPDWSPDGTQIVFESDRDDPHPVSCFPNCAFKIYLMCADGTGERRLMDLPGLEGHPDWSSDGRSIVFHADRDGNGKHEIYAVSVDGEALAAEPRLVIGDAFDNTAPDWSPDGSSIAFNSDREGSLDIFVVGVDGTGLRKVVDTGVNDYFPDWSPDGTQILFFAANWPAVRQDIYVVHADGTGLGRLTDTPRVVDESAQWTPDGERIVFQSDRDGNFEIYSMRCDGTDVVRLTRRGGGDYWPDMWLPPAAAAAAEDGTGKPAEASLSDTEASALAVAQEMPAEASAADTEASALGAASRRPVAFVSTRSGRAQIYTMDADGLNPVRLTSEFSDDYYPAWSPDGTRIAFYVHLSWQSWALFVMNADGSERHQIATEAGCATCAMGPYWSPDGTQIGFTIEPDPQPTCEIKSTELGVVTIDGSDCHQLTDNAWNDLFCGWSPDGESIMFVSNREGRDQVYAMGVSLSNVRKLTAAGSTNNMPSWSPDGTRIAFVSDRDGNDEIYVMNADGTSVTRITFDPAHDWMPAWSADGTELLFSSDRGGQSLDVYAVDLDDLTVRRLTTGPGYNYEAVWRP